MRTIAILATVIVALATASAAQAAKRTIKFNDGLGAKAVVTYKIIGKRVEFAGKLKDKKGDGYHARIYGYTNGKKFGIRKATRGKTKRFRSASPVKTFFEVCTYDRNVPLRCTTKFKFVR